MIGLSLSMCIKDIMLGEVPEGDVTKIITNTFAQSDEDWQRLCESYQRTYWRHFDGDAVLALIGRLRAQAKIEQPRLLNPDYHHSIHRGWWRREDETLIWARDALREEVANLADDPTHLTAEYRHEEPAEYFARIRRVAADLGLDFDALLAEQYGCDLQRIKDIENGVITPLPRRIGGG